MKAISGRDLAKLLDKNGWVLRRIKGSHHIFAKTGRFEWMPFTLILPCTGFAGVRQ
ncbi:MAG: type II toxin-antitoxin system HicA family toxin, partial [Desulfonatronovibrio sp.]